MVSIHQQIRWLEDFIEKRRRFVADHIFDAYNERTDYDVRVLESVLVTLKGVAQINVRLLDGTE
jgi:hypothetical protein